MIKPALLFFLLLPACTLPETEEPGMATPDLSIGIIARQSYWAIHCPGPDGVLGKTSYKWVNPANPAGIDHTDTAGTDDFVTTRALHLPKDRSVVFYIRSLDVIHSAYFPHFKMQMNAVPGITTKARHTAQKTTAEMRQELHNSGFNYMLMCNKICGPRHHQMQMKIVVVTKGEFTSWASERKMEYENLIKLPPAVK